MNLLELRRVGDGWSLHAGEAPNRLFKFQLSRFYGGEWHYYSKIITEHDVVRSHADFQERIEHDVRGRLQDDIERSQTDRQSIG